MEIEQKSDNFGIILRNRHLRAKSETKVYDYFYEILSKL